MTTTIRRRRSGSPNQRVRAHTVRLTNLEMRAEADGLPDGICGAVTGVALVYDVVDSYQTKFAPGSLDRTKREKVAAKKAQLFLDHVYGVRMHVGYVAELRTVGDTEVMVGHLFDTEDGRRAKEYLSAVTRSGANTGLSVGFWGRMSEIVTDDDGDKALRYTEIELDEVSIVPRPAVPGTKVTGVRREADPEKFRPALEGIRAAIGAEAFTALVDSLDEDDEGTNAARHTEDTEDSDDAELDSRDAEGTETPAETLASMDDRIAAVRASYRR